MKQRSDRADDVVAAGALTEIPRSVLLTCKLQSEKGRKFMVTSGGS